VGPLLPYKVMPECPPHGSPFSLAADENLQPPPSLACFKASRDCKTSRAIYTFVLLTAGITEMQPPPTLDQSLKRYIVPSGVVDPLLTPVLSYCSPNGPRKPIAGQGTHPWMERSWKKKKYSRVKTWEQYPLKYLISR
jgi:hypothetical protein